MNSLLARLVLLLSGSWSRLTSSIESVEWGFAAWGRPLLWFGIPLGILLAALCYWRTTEGLTPKARVFLGILRGSAVCCLVILAAGIVCRIDIIRAERPELLILVDDSASMKLEQGDRSREQLGADVLRPGGPLAALTSAYRVRVKMTSAVLGRDGTRALTQDLAEALARASAGRGGRLPGQVLLISDGIQTSSTELSAAAQRAGAPISALAYGDGRQDKDARIHTAVVPPFVYHQDRVVVTSEVRSFGMAGQAELRLAHLRGGTETVAAVERFALLPDETPVPVRLEFNAKHVGLQQYRLHLVPADGELSTDNNDLIFNLDVRPERIRVLFVEGKAGWEYRYAKRAFERDPAVDFYGLLRVPPDEWFYQGAPKRPDGKPVLRNSKHGFPNSPEEMRYFDVLILGDLERKIFEQAHRFDLVTGFVQERGGGLATIGGYSVYTAGHYAGTALAKLLPVRLDREQKKHLINRFKVQLTAQGLMHPIMQLESDPARNEKAWSGLPWVEGGNAWRRLKPSATRLLNHPSLRTSLGPRPIAAVWQCGRGRVFSSALDGTWHWSTARETEADYHQRFWGLLVRWLAGDTRERRGNAMILETMICEVGRPVNLAVALRDAASQAITDAKVQYEIIPPNSPPEIAYAAVTLAAPGRYGLNLVPEHPGAYTVKATCRLADGKNRKYSLKFAVNPSRAEIMNVRPDEEALRRLTKASGGNLAPIGDAASLVLPETPKTTRSERLSIRLWQAPGLALLLLLALVFEWFLRKRRGLA